MVSFFVDVLASKCLIIIPYPVNSETEEFIYSLQGKQNLCYLLMRE